MRDVVDLEVSHKKRDRVNGVAVVNQDYVLTMLVSLRVRKTNNVRMSGPPQT